MQDHTKFLFGGNEKGGDQDSNLSLSRLSLPPVGPMVATHWEQVIEAGLPGTACSMSGVPK